MLASQVKSRKSNHSQSPSHFGYLSYFYVSPIYILCIYYRQCQNIIMPHIFVNKINGFILKCKVLLFIHFCELFCGSFLAMLDLKLTRCFYFIVYFLNIFLYPSHIVVHNLTLVTADLTRFYQFCPMFSNVFSGIEVPMQKSCKFFPTMLSPRTSPHQNISRLGGVSRYFLFGRYSGIFKIICKSFC